tara:strand:+ start:72 stop:188 length:117 start_codon:yes stop_codon:yes gene_type:complete
LLEEAVVDTTEPVVAVRVVTVQVLAQAEVEHLLNQHLP